MKTIQVTDKVYEALAEISRNMNAQDNRCTAYPILFQIQTNEQKAAPEGCGEPGWYSDGTVLETEEEITDAIFDYKDEELTKDAIRSLSELARDEMMEEAGWEKGYYIYEHKYQNAFFTEKACEEHIRLNHYHYAEPKSYVDHAFRNPEMEIIQNFLINLTK